MEMLSTFSAVFHVSNLSTSEHLMACLEELVTFSPKELDTIARMTTGKRYTNHVPNN